MGPKSSSPSRATMSRSAARDPKVVDVSLGVASEGWRYTWLPDPRPPSRGSIILRSSDLGSVLRTVCNNIVIEIQKAKQCASSGLNRVEDPGRT